MIMFQGWGTILSEAKPYPPHKHILGSRHRSVSTAASGLRLNWRNRNDQRLHLAVLERACLRFSLDMLGNGSHPCISRAIGQERPMKQRAKWKRRNCDNEYVDASNVSCFIRHGLCLSRRTWIRERGGRFVSYFREARLADHKPGQPIPSNLSTSSFQSIKLLELCLPFHY